MLSLGFGGGMGLVHFSLLDWVGFCWAVRFHCQLYLGCESLSKYMEISCAHIRIRESLDESFWLSIFVLDICLRCV